MVEKDCKLYEAGADEASEYMPKSVRGAKDSPKAPDAGQHAAGDQSWGKAETSAQPAESSGTSEESSSDAERKPRKKGGLLGGLRNRKKDGRDSIKGSINKSLGLSADGVKEVQERLEKLTLAVTVAAAVTVFAVIFAGWTGWQSYSTAQALKASMHSVVVAAEEIPAGTTITKDMLKMKDVPADYLAADATSNAGQFIGERANVDIAANDQVTAKMVSGAGNVTSAAAQLSNGEVGLALPVSSTKSSGIGGTIRQGNTVNVLAITKEGDVYVALKSARVVALDANLSTTPSKYSTVTIAVTPKEAATVLGLASKKDMKFSLTLNPADTGASDNAAEGE